ncbi:MAG: PD40 domain-containing protein, partial [Phycisphaerales bacterium]|nr:PD40 domain-containing protein [Phycisphaerales bacterium]
MNQTSRAACWIAAASAVMFPGPLMAAGPDINAVRPDATLLQFPDVSARHIVFVYANDLWIVPREGGEARRLASPPGGESFPRFSPDGQTIAFGGNYEGNRDIYTIPIGGGLAERITYHPAAESLCDWHKDLGLIFHSNGRAGLGRMQQIFTVPPEGGLPEQMPVPYGANGAVSDDGRWLAYTPHQRDFRTWKRYRGGMASDIWLFNLRNQTAEQATDWEGTDTFPMWHGNTLYYLSDGGPEHRLNIWSYDPRSKKREQVTRFADFDCKWPAMGPSPNGTGEIVFQNGPKIYLLDLRSGKANAVDIVIPGDRPTLRPQLVDYSNYVNAGSISPTGKRVVVEARGDIWSLPAEKGVTRNLTHSSGVAERDPSWSPDGQWIAYLSDESGEYELYVTQSDGKGETRRLTEDGGAYRYLGNWSPDSKFIAFTDKTGAVYLYGMESDEVQKIATDPWANQPTLSWTQDSRWIAMNLATESTGTGVINIYNVETGELTPVTEPMFNCGSPAFDRAGKYLYFTCDMNFSPTYSSIDSTYIYDDSTLILAAPLTEEVEYPWMPESDEEAWDSEEDKSDDAGADDETTDEAAAVDVHALQGTWEGSYMGPEGMFPPGGISFTFTIAVNDDGELFGTATAEGESTALLDLTFDEATGDFSARTEEEGMSVSISGHVDGDAMEGTWESSDLGISGEFSATRTSTENDADAAGGSGTSDEPVEIVLEGLHHRAILLPVGSGRIGNLAVNDSNKLLYQRDGDIKLFDIEDREKGEQNVISGVGGFGMSADGKKLLVFRGNGGAVISAAPGQSMSKMIPTSAMQGSIKPREEWSQILRDAWRIQRDFF